MLQNLDIRGREVAEQVASGLISQISPFAAVQRNHKQCDYAYATNAQTRNKSIDYWGNPHVGLTVIKDAGTGTVLHSNEIPLAFHSGTFWYGTELDRPTSEEESACRNLLGGSTVSSMPGSHTHPTSFRMRSFSWADGLLARNLHNAVFRVKGVTTHVFPHAECELPVYVCDELGAVVCVQAFSERELGAFQNERFDMLRALHIRGGKDLWFGDLAADMKHIQDELHAVALRQSAIREILSDSNKLSVLLRGSSWGYVFGLLQNAIRMFACAPIFLENSSQKDILQDLVSLGRKVEDGATHGLTQVGLTQVNADFQTLLGARLGELEVEAGLLSAKLRACRTKRDAVANATSFQLNWVAFALPGGKLWDRVFPSNTGSIWLSENQNHHSSGVIRKFCALPGWTSATIHKSSVLGLNEGWSDFDGNYQPISPSVTAVPLMIAPLTSTKSYVVSDVADPRDLHWAVPMAHRDKVRCKTADLWDSLIHALPENHRTRTPTLPNGYVADHYLAGLVS